MVNYLDAIVERKRRELEFTEVEAVRPRIGDRAFSRSLRQAGLSVIAEIKRRSPSTGKFVGELAVDPAARAHQYERAGAAAISVLTDKIGFGGTLEDLSDAAKKCQIPLLRKDFILASPQVDEAVKAGASALLLIVAILQEKLADLLQYTERMGLEALVEVHTEKELELALASGATLIGINNRNLHTFEVDLRTSLRLRPLIPEGVVTVSESGIRSEADAQLMKDQGFDAVLVGQALMQSHLPEALIERLRQC